MKVKWTVQMNKIPQIQKAAAQLDGRHVQAGVFGEQAWLAGIHEYGCKIKVTNKMRAYLHSQGLHLKDSTAYITIPERAFLRNGYAEGNEGIIQDANTLLPLVLSGDLSSEQYLAQIGQWMVSHIRDYTTALSSPANHPFTVEKKGSSNPLVDTGDMIGSISYEVE